MKSFNASASSQAKWMERHQTLMALYGRTEDERRDRALEETYLRLFGKAPQSPAEVYAAQEAIEHVPVLAGRGED